MENKDRFDRVLSRGDILALSFGAMIGWSWVIMTGEWIDKGGSIGAILAFLIGGITVLFVGLAYAELTTALPRCGGELHFTMRTMGKNASFICTWTLLLGYIGVVAFEACALPTVIQYLFPNFLQGYLYTVAGFDVYATWLAVALVSGLIITVINCMGVKSSARFQNILVWMVALVGIALVAGGVVTGKIENMNPQFVGGFDGIISVATMTPFLFLGFDLIPQAVEEMNVPFKKIGKIMVLSILMAILWYILIIFAVSIVLPVNEIDIHSLPTADAMKKIFANSKIASSILIIGGMAGIITSWNSFFMGGSKMIFAMAEEGIFPQFLTKLSKKHKTPVNASLLIGLISLIAPFFGRRMMVWITDAGGLGTIIAYFMVSLSLILLRKQEPELHRPYKLTHGYLVGALALLFSAIMIVLYIVPGFASALVVEEWIVVGSWTAIGAVLFATRKIMGVKSK